MQSTLTRRAIMAGAAVPLASVASALPITTAIAGNADAALIELGPRYVDAVVEAHHRAEQFGSINDTVFGEVRAFAGDFNNRENLTAEDAKHFVAIHKAAMERAEGGEEYSRLSERMDEADKVTEDIELSIVNAGASTPKGLAIKTLPLFRWHWHLWSKEETELDWSDSVLRRFVDELVQPFFPDLRARMIAAVTVPQE